MFKTDGNNVEAVCMTRGGSLPNGEEAEHALPQRRRSVLVVLGEVVLTARPSSICANVRPSKRSGVCTVWSASPSVSAKPRRASVSPSAWWKTTTSAMATER